MYDQSMLSELIKFAHVDTGSTVIDVYPGDGDWTRIFSDVVGPEGRVYQLCAGRSGRLQERSGRPHADACEGAGPRECRSRVSGPRSDAEGHATLKTAKALGL